MNLNENISRVKSLMGIISEDAVTLGLSRRMGELPRYIRSTYNWLNAKAFINFEEFVDRVVFSTTRDFVADLSVRPYEEQLEIREIVAPIIKKMIDEEFIDEMKEYFIKERQSN